MMKYHRPNGYGPSLGSYINDHDDNNTTYMLEVQSFIGKGRFVHIGYMNTLFNYPDEACSYYRAYNSHLRNINDSMCSDWDEENHLRYVVRPYNGELLTIDPFDHNDIPIIVERSNDSLSGKYLTIFSKSVYEDLKLIHESSSK